MLKRKNHFLEHFLYLCLIYFVLWTLYFLLFGTGTNAWIAFASVFAVAVIIDTSICLYTGNMYWNIADIIDEYHYRKALKKATQEVAQEEEIETTMGVTAKESYEELSEVRRKIGEAGYEYSYFYDNPQFDQAIVGVDENSKVVYEYDMMIDAYVENEFSDRTFDDEGDEDYFDACTQAMEWIDYNTIRATPYMGALAPVIIAWNPEDEKWYNMITLDDYDTNTIEFDINKEALKDYEV